VVVAPDGDLWVGTIGELIRIPSSSFNQFTISGWISYHIGPDKANQINCLRFSRSGVLWVETADGLFRYDGDQFVAIGPRVPTLHIKETPDGHMLVITLQGFTEFAGSEVVAHPRLADQLGVKDNEIFDVLKDNHGNTWYRTAEGVAREP
jgi:ligand-binding sensor domain-containing protein